MSRLHRYTIVIGFSVAETDFFKEVPDGTRCMGEGGKRHERPDDAIGPYCPQHGGKWAPCTRKVPTEAHLRWLDDHPLTGWLAEKGWTSFYDFANVSEEFFHTAEVGNRQMIHLVGIVPKLSKKVEDDHQRLSLRDLPRYVRKVRRLRTALGFSGRPVGVHLIKARY